MSIDNFKIGVHITTYNRKLFTDQCLKSFLWDNPVNVEFVVVDNNSQDGTKELLKSYANNYKNVNVILLKSNEGLGFAVNQGWNVLSRTCHVLAWINNDFLAEPGWDDNVRACFNELNLDYIVGTVRPDREKNRVVTKSGLGKFTKKNDVGAAYFILVYRFREGVKPSTKPFIKNYEGPGPSFHNLLIKRKLKGVRLAQPGILVRDSEYSKEEHIKYYNETFKIRNLNKHLTKFRNMEANGQRRGWINWEEFINKYYSDKIGK